MSEVRLDTLEVGQEFTHRNVRKAKFLSIKDDKSCYTEIAGGVWEFSRKALVSVIYGGSENGEAQEVSTGTEAGAGDLSAAK